MQTIRLAIVIPTRNRAELAIRSVESVLSSRDRETVSLILSDNSTDPAESAALRSYISKIDAQVTLIRPASPLSMTKHWNFALDHALNNTGCTHFAFLTDRMLFKKDALSRLLAIISEYPDKVVSYTYERIDDMRIPVVYKPLPRSGKLLEISSRRLLAMSARMLFPSCLPRMLNSVCTRTQLMRMTQRFGAVFDSVSPDFLFCYRTLDAEDSILYLDQSLLLNYAQARSNGGSFSRGVMTRDSIDFIASVGAENILRGAPLPSIVVGTNGNVSEYCLVKESSTSGKFEEISYPAYLDMLAAEASGFVDQRAVSEILQALRLAGWRETWRFRLAKRIRRLRDMSLMLGWRKFASVEDALAFAGSHVPVAWSWLPHPALRYGRVLPWPCAAPTSRGA